MPTAWTDKRERQYEHVKQSELEKGAPMDRAKEIAARTVNKTRREAGETPSRRTQGTGNPRTRLETRSRDELVNRAKQLGIPMNDWTSKEDLIDAIRGRM